MAEWLCNSCKLRYPNEFMHETHKCSGLSNRGQHWRPSMPSITCGNCKNTMDSEKYGTHACIVKGKEKANENSQRIGVFVSPNRIDVTAMRLAATEFPRANYLLRGMYAEEPFCKVAKEMGSNIMVCASTVGVEDLDKEIMKKSEFLLMFPSRDHYKEKEIMKFSLKVNDKKLLTIVYPDKER